MSDSVKPLLTEAEDIEYVNELIGKFMPTLVKSQEVLKEYNWKLGIKEPKYHTAFYKFHEVKGKINALKFIVGDDPLSEEEYMFPN